MHVLDRENRWFEGGVKETNYKMWTKHDFSFLTLELEMAVFGAQTF